MQCVTQKASLFWKTNCKCGCVACAMQSMDGKMSKHFCMCGHHEDAHMLEPSGTGCTDCLRQEFYENWDDL